MKKVKFSLIVLILVSIFFGCQNEEDLPIESTIALKAKLWYEAEHSELLENNPNFYGKPDWENFIETDNELYFPLLENNSPVQRTTLGQININLIFAKSYLVIKNVEEFGFEESMKVFVSIKNDSFKDVSNLFGLSYLHYDSNNELIEYQFKERGIDVDIIKQNTKEANLSARCTTFYVIQTDTYTDGSQEVMILGSYQKCDGVRSGSGGNGGDGNDGDLPTADEPPPPSCESFNFQKTGSNWQEANVKNIYFQVFLVHAGPPYLEYAYTVKLDKPVLFGAPLKDRFGSDITPGKLASASAFALHDTMKDTVDKFDGADVDPYQVELFFKERLRENYPLHIIGGRANTNSTSSIPARNYRATPDINFGGCHNED